MNYKDLSRIKELSGIKEADRSDVTHAQLLPHIKNVKAAMVRHAQEDPSEAREFIEHLDDMMDAGDVEVVDMMQPDYMDTEARDSLIFYFQVSISQDPALYNMLFPGSDIKFAQGEYADMFESLTPVKENLVDDMPHGLLDGMTFTDGSPDYDYMGNAMNDGEVDWPEINDWHKDENGNVKPEATMKPADFEISDLEADSEEYYESEIHRLKELSGIKEDASSLVFQIMKKSLLRHKWYLENEEMDPNMVSSELRDVNKMIEAVDLNEAEPYFDTAVNNDYMALYREAIAKSKGKKTSIYGVDNDVLPPNAKPNPKSAYNSGEVEKNDAELDALNPTESEVRRLRELSGITEAPYQYDMSDKGDMHDALAGVQNSMDDAVKSIQKASGLARQVSDEIENSLYTDESVEEEAVDEGH
mgnify:FL=1